MVCRLGSFWTETGMVLNTLDGRNPAPLKKPNDDSSVNTNNQWSQPWFQNGAVYGFRVHPQYVLTYFSSS